MTTKNITGKIEKVSGALVVAGDMRGANIQDVVRVGPSGLIGEIIELHGDTASVQVYEETSGLKPGDVVTSTGAPLSLLLGPGMLGAIYDGIQRPLDVIQASHGAFIARGAEAPALDEDKKWQFTATREKGSEVTGGDIIGTVQEGPLVHSVMVPPHVSGILISIAKGGTSAIPGPFGSGKSVAQQQLAKWSDADVIVYIGCGERGNEMTDVLLEFPELEDPKTGESLMKRTILIANTSNMPVAAREASVYTGITIAEYFRDMGYSVALMADSTSRWAEALREMSGRLEEMPGDEGYPAYLGSRTAQFYERAGIADVLGTPGRQGSLTAIGAVSPPGGDLSEPVTQNTLSVVKVFWGLEERLAYRRHYPAINWLTSYSLYLDQLASYFEEHAGHRWNTLRAEAMSILQQEAALDEIVRLVGLEALSKHEQLVLHIARMIREDYLQQNAYDEVDTFTSLHKQYRMLSLLLTLYTKADSRLREQDFSMQSFLALSVLPEISRSKFIAEHDVDTAFDVLQASIDSAVASLTSQ